MSKNKEKGLAAIMPFIQTNWFALLIAGLVLWFVWSSPFGQNLTQNIFPAQTIVTTTEFNYPYADCHEEPLPDGSGTFCTGECPWVSLRAQPFNPMVERVCERDSSTNTCICACYEDVEPEPEPEPDQEPDTCVWNTVNLTGNCPYSEFRNEYCCGNCTAPNEICVIYWTVYGEVCGCIEEIHT